MSLFYQHPERIFEVVEIWLNYREDVEVSMHELASWYAKRDRFLIRWKAGKYLVEVRVGEEKMNFSYFRFSRFDQVGDDN